MTTLKERISAERISALKAKNSSRSQIISLILAAIMQVEVDTRVEQNDDGVLTVLNKMIKQRNESISQFNAAGRTDLTDIEEKELVVIKEFLPTQLSEAEVAMIIDNAFTLVLSDGFIATIREMGKIMAIVKPQLHGKYDMSKASQIIKGKLS